MKEVFGEVFISDDRNLIHIDRVCELLSKTYWARNRSRDDTQKSIDNSLCFGVYINDRQIGFARCITDYAVVFYLADVVIDEEYRGRGIGKLLLKCITEHEDIATLIGFLNTDDAHGLYEHFGFRKDTGTAMCRRVKPR